MISLVLKRRNLAENIQSYMKLKLPDGSEKRLIDLFQGQPEQLLAAFRASKWTIPHVNSLQRISSSFVSSFFRLEWI